MACGCCGGSCTCDEHEAHRGFLERVLEGFESWPALVVALVCLVSSFVLVGQGCGHEAATAVPVRLPFTEKNMLRQAVLTAVTAERAEMLFL